MPEAKIELPRVAPESPSGIDIGTASKDSANQTLGAQFHSGKKPLETLFAEISMSPFLEKLGADAEPSRHRDAKTIPDAFFSNGLAFRNQNYTPSFIDFSSTKYVTLFSRPITQSSLSRNLKLRLPSALLAKFPEGSSYPGAPGFCLLSCIEKQEAVVSEHSFSSLPFSELLANVDCGLMQLMQDEMLKGHHSACVEYQERFSAVDPVFVRAMYDFASKQAQSFELKKSLSDSPKLKPEAGTQAILKAIKPVNKPELKPELKSWIRPEFKQDPEASIAFDAPPGLLKFLTPMSSDDIISAEEWKLLVR